MWSCGVVAAVLRRETFERACVLGKWFPSLRSPHATGHLPATRDPNIQIYPRILILASLSFSLNSLSSCFEIFHPLLILSQFFRNLYNFPILIQISFIILRLFVSLLARILRCRIDFFANALINQTILGHVLIYKYPHVGRRL